MLSSGVRTRWAVLAPLVLAAWAPAAQAQVSAPAADKAAQAQPKLGEKWVRLKYDARKHPLAMEVAIVRYVDADVAREIAAGKKVEPPRYVDLVGAIHIGDHGYYDNLNRRFEQYDALLYELVAPEGTIVPKGRGTSNSHPLGALQNAMKNMLEVEHQLEQIDYTKANFVHADLSPDEFMESMDAKDESFLEMYMRLMGSSLAQQSQQGADGEVPEFDIFTAMLSDDRARLLKVALAKQFEGMEQLLNGLSGPEGSTLITERNKRALDVLEEQLGEGKKKLAIFYGAGHLAEMSKDLEKRFDMRPISAEWLEAWDLREK